MAAQRPKQHKLAAAVAWGASQEETRVAFEQFIDPNTQRQVVERERWFVRTLVCYHAGTRERRERHCGIGVGTARATRSALIITRMTAVLAKISARRVLRAARKRKQWTRNSRSRRHPAASSSYTSDTRRTLLGVDFVISIDSVDGIEICFGLPRGMQKYETNI